MAAGTVEAMVASRLASMAAEMRWWSVKVAEKAQEAMVAEQAVATAVIAAESMATEWRMLLSQW